MNGYKVGFYVASAGLVTSIAYQQLMGTEAPTAPAPAGSTIAATSRSTATPASTGPGANSKLDELRSQLDQCRDSSWELVARVVAERHQVSTKAGPTDDKATDLDKQRRALTNVALLHLREHWQSSRDDIIKAMGYVGSEEWVQADVSKKVAAHRRRFDLNDADAQRLHGGYTDLWSRYGDTMNGFVANQDWQGLAGEVRDFWKDEDRMVGSILGHDQSAAYRESDTAGRTAIMAILATFDDEPWDESIAW